VSERHSAAAAAAEQVRAIVEAAERSAAELRAEAEREVDALLEHARAVTDRLSARANEIERSLQGMSDRLRDELTALKADLEELRAVGEGLGEQRAAPPVADPEPEAAAPAAETASPTPGDGHEGARVIALNMALNGSSREETARYLAENFELEDPDALLDEVYARVSG
jgi:ABC-type transporter Mla subunit MlaD